MKKHGLDCVFLDMTHKGEDFLREHFPNIHARCLELGIDIAKEPIPVVPAAHYTCGGMVVDLDGAHRPARPVCARRSRLHRAAWRQPPGQQLAARMPGVRRSRRAGHLARRSRQSCRICRSGTKAACTDADEEIVISHNWDELRRFMWDYVGIVRTNKRLERALHRIRLLEREIDEFYANFRVSNDLIELRNLVLTAHLIVAAP